MASCGRVIGVGGGDVACRIAGAFVNGTRDLAGGRIRTALWFERTAVAVQLAGATAHHAVFIDQRPRHSINPLPLPELLPGRADVTVAFAVIREVVTRESAIGALGFVEHWDMRLDSAF